LLDAETKRRIDTARDILVGKVPDPKSQVEQITIALIYKFMDDMDAESEELGGKRKFFTGEFARFGWAKLMRAGLGGHETLNLYAEGITTMPQNAGIPLLFREIFKNAYLPYRDPETLKSFLKIIDEFSYDHSERLGDAFEYLLSVLGSQGDAGQFRTPRHIIDFMVSVVDPKKDETILDPACGTAGFLISSWKHILSANTDVKGKLLLTPDERGRLAKNFKGYDISPDMVRLSLVNLYLHGFTDPHIYEYDTLTQEERWKELADVILANPPFMSPKGGIKPHKKFSIDAKRSEVLFVDYMAEHLTANGRAGIIVPEGIIFQSQTAYKELRKALLKDSLVAVISLPAGCFNPYSGVKTSILILDKSIAKQSETIGFFKVANDGFGLGAQRRAIDKDDLPQVQQELDAYLNAIRNHKSTEDLQLSCGLIVSKEKITENGDYNLSGERYREGVVSTGVWPMVALGDITTRVSGGTPSKENCEFWRGTIPWVSPKDMKQHVLYDTEDHVSSVAVESSATTLVPVGTLLCVVRSGILKHSLPLAITAREMCFNQDLIALVPSEGTLESRFLFWILKARSTEILETGIKPGVTVQSFHSGFFNQLLIPLPPLEVQREIVAEIEGYQKVIDGARAVLDNYRPHIPIHPDWPNISFEEAPFEIIDGDRGSNYPSKEDFSPYGFCLFLNTKNVRFDGFKFDDLEFITTEKDQTLRKGKLRRGDVVLTTRGTIGNTAIYDDSVPYEHIRINSGMLIFRPDEKAILGSYLFHFFQSENFRKQREAISSGAAQPQLPIRNLKDAVIPVPGLDVQLSIVAEIEAEQALVNANRELIARFEKKIQTTLARVWGEDDPPAVEA